MIDNAVFANMLARPVRELRGRIEVYEGINLIDICGCHDALQSFTIERTGDNKFFGYGICQKLNVKLIDKDRKQNITTANYLEAVFGVGSDYIYAFPKFNVTEVHRDEKNNELSITAYDDLYSANRLKVSDLDLAASYTVNEFIVACANLLNLPLRFINIPEAALNTEYAAGANLDGTESIREVLNAVAEVTQSIYYVSNDWELTFKGLDLFGDSVFTIGKELYFTLDSGENRRLSTIANVTELGDNVEVSTSLSGSTQYIRNNPFWELREDIADLLNAAIGNVGNLTINQFNCNWRGNFLLEIGDKFNIVTKDNNLVTTYLLNDSLSFDGSLSQVTEWKYINNDEETYNNPVSLGDALKQTYARVDKANKQIEIVASETASNKEAISTLLLDTGSITATVEKLEQTTENALSGLNDNVAELTSRVEAVITSDDVSLQISEALVNGVDKVVTTTGFIFNEEGLTVSKSGSEMTTTIKEDGMRVYRDNTEVLTADNEGVKAEDLHATTYLIVGKNSRFEDYIEGRTGCFWIGG